MIRSFLLLFTLCLLAFHAAGQSTRPFLEMGKRGRKYHSPITPIQLDSSIKKIYSIHFRADSMAKWQPLGLYARPLRPYMDYDPSMKKRFLKFQNTKFVAVQMVIGAPIMYSCAALSFLGYVLSGLGEIPPSATSTTMYDRDKTLGYVALGSFIAGTGFAIIAVKLRKKANRQLIRIINRYNDPLLSMTPPLQKNWSLRLGLSTGGNSIGVGLRLCPH